MVAGSDRSAEEQTRHGRDAEQVHVAPSDEEHVDNPTQRVGNVKRLGGRMERWNYWLARIRLTR